MAYFTKHKTFHFNNKFKQNKPKQEIFISQPFDLAATARLVKVNKTGCFDKKTILKQLAVKLKRRFVRRKNKDRVRYFKNKSRVTHFKNKGRVTHFKNKGRVTHFKNKNRIIYFKNKSRVNYLKNKSRVLRRVRLKKFRSKNISIFFPRIIKKKSKQNVLFQKLLTKRSAKFFALSPIKQFVAMKKYTEKNQLTRVEGVYIWALLQANNPHTSLLQLYRTTINRSKMRRKIRRQCKWERRQTTWFFRFLKRTKKPLNRNILLPQQQSIFKRQKKKVFNKKMRYLFLKTRHQFFAWRRVIIKRAWHWKYKRLQYKLRSKVPQRLRLSKFKSFGKKFKKQMLQLHKTKLARKIRYPSLFSIWNFHIRDVVRIHRLRLLKEELEKSIDNKNNQAFDFYDRHFKIPIQKKKSVQTDKKSDSLIKIVKRHAKVVKRLQHLQAPLPWWKKKQIAAQYKPSKINFLESFKRATQPVNKLKLHYIRWFKFQTDSYNVFKSTIQWRGLSRDVMFNQYYKRLYGHKKARRSTKKRGFIGLFPVKGWKKGVLQYALQKVALRSVMHIVKPTIPIATTNVWLSHKPLFFSLYKATKALNFNKFFKVNTLATRFMVSLGSDLYTHYLSNLQALATTAVVLSKNANKKNTYTARVLRKYMKLLRAYFTDVYDTKLLKKIPAASTMYWIREYLYLTSSFKKRVSLWNRFNHVSFHFIPKAKEVEKRGRKKKILFKAKILFDRLFKWLYAQPNARYALAEPIQNGVIRDYIIRNQFIFKKQFKIKLSSKIS